jgi:hypothetical protein
MLLRRYSVINSPVVYVKVYPGGFMTVCKKCGIEFDGIRCKPCNAKYMREWNANNPEKARAIRSKKYEKYKGHIDEKNNEWANKNREKSNEIKKAYKQRNREKYLAQQREYANKRYVENREKLLLGRLTPESKEAYKKWYEENRVRLNEEYLHRYHTSDEMKRKHSARNKVRRALISGRLVMAKECSRCGSLLKLQAHHEDYSKPLEVEWLCISCHKKEHSKHIKQEDI